MFFRFIFDNICLVVFGVDFCCLVIIDLFKKKLFVEVFEEVIEYFLFRFMVLLFVWKIMKYFNLGKEKKFKEVVKIVYEFVEIMVKNWKVDMNKFGIRKIYYDFCDFLFRFIKM